MTWMVTSATVAAEQPRCLQMNFRPAESATVHYVCFALVMLCSLCHGMVIIVCWRERKRASYKRDIVYMMALAAVDFLFCFFIPIAVEIQAIATSVAFRYAVLLVTMCSLTLLTIRATERFLIVITNTTLTWSFKFQISVCFLVTSLVAMLVISVDYYTEFSLVRVYACICSVIILGAYTAVIGKVVKQYFKLKFRVGPTISDQSEGAITRTSEMRLKETLEDGIPGPSTSTMWHELPPNNTKTRLPSLEVMQAKDEMNTQGKSNAAVANHTSDDVINILPAKYLDGKENRSVTDTTKTDEQGSRRPACSNTTTRSAPRPRSKVEISRKKSVYRVGFGLLLVTFAFYLSWAPVFLLSLSDSVPCEVTLIYLLNFVINPFIYVMTIENFRKSVVKMIKPGCLK